MNKTRGFEVVKDGFRKFPDKEIKLPKRKTYYSAGYDFYSNETITIRPGESHHFMTDVKAYMQPNEVLIINVRSSIGFKKGLRLINTQGWIDADFYGNPENDGNIGICLINDTFKPVTIEEGERIAQGIFIRYLITDDDDAFEKEARVGGIGSTGK